MTEKFTIKQWRGVRGLTQEELAKMSGVSAKTIYTYETEEGSLGNAKYITVQRIADALEVRLDDIFLGITSEKPKQQV